ncbi:nose resistant to fluoxetine protein 6 [Ixodes scapularis]
MRVFLLSFSSMGALEVFKVHQTPVFARYQQDKRVHGVRIGLCVEHECNEEDLENLFKLILVSDMEVKVQDCVTNQVPLIDDTQAGIITFLCVLAFVLVLSTAIDLIHKHRYGKDAFRGKLVKYLTTFSIPASTKTMLAVNRDKQSDAYKLRFLHGIRFFSLVWIVLGHSYSTFNFSSVSRLVNALHYGDDISGCFITAGYLSVDTFLFLSGFLLTYNLRRERVNGFLGGCIALVRRWIRGTVPIFFVIMCTFLLPLFINGPNAKEIFGNFYTEFRNQYWALLLQIRNFTKDLHIGMYGHLWYMSTDFQLFVVTVFIIQLFKKRFWSAVIMFSVLSLIACTISMWEVHNTVYTPFPLPMADNFTLAVGTVNEVYPHPSYHGAAFFLGAITQLLLIKYSSVKISKLFQTGMWLITAICGLTAILSMYEWNRGAHPPEWAKLSFAFSERLLWAIWLSWLTFACATGRASFISHFFSWGAFAPLSRLSFGVYLLHVPYYNVRLSTARERLFFSHFTMVTQCFGALVTSYLLSLVLFVVCEAPTGRLEKLILMPSRRPEKPSGTNEDQLCVEDAFKNFSAPDVLVKKKGMQVGNRNGAITAGQSSHL